ncbi:hypothetical protein PGTUg99_029811 [Puccinia graminis f. sp. tritici]|uniref:Uncharacterized protein n=1 Tax=Puccinia graminis f. sp. tritici TaxID=56615 RepID=A0A5B0QRY2_PUCGR|nr:hypothetical protein PGTUg99_029811 [Puccinia graminis f. sp. tritici]
MAGEILAMGNIVIRRPSKPLETSPKRQNRLGTLDHAQEPSEVTRKAPSPPEAVGLGPRTDQYCWTAVRQCLNVPETPRASRIPEAPPSIATTLQSEHIVKALPATL